MATLTVEGRSRTSPAAGSRYRRFRPRLVLGYQQDLQSLIEELTAMPTAEARVVLDLAIEKLDERQEALQTFGLKRHGPDADGSLRRDVARFAARKTPPCPAAAVRQHVRDRDRHPPRGRSATRRRGGSTSSTSRSTRTPRPRNGVNRCANLLG